LPHNLTSRRDLFQGAALRLSGLPK
jgi:hypothetical protein